jgi:RNA polymerase sigma factor (sigma-70 family)
MITDAELIKDIKENNSSDSFIELSNRHSKLFYKICQKYHAAFLNSGISPEDVHQEKDHTIYKSIITFNPDKKTKFSTWLGNYTKYSCLNFLKKNAKYATFEDCKKIEYFLDKHASDNDAPDYSGLLERVYEILESSSDDRIYKIFKLRYDLGDRKKATWKTIAKKIDVSAQTAINLHNKGIKIICKKMKVTPNEFSRHTRS